MRRSLFPTKSSRDSLRLVLLAIIEEHLRQARWTFNLSFLAIALSLGMSVTGGLLILKGEVSDGTASAASGLICTGICIQAAKEASDKLEQLSKNLQEIQQIRK